MSDETIQVGDRVLYDGTEETARVEPGEHTVRDVHQGVTGIFYELDGSWVHEKRVTLVSRTQLSKPGPVAAAEDLPTPPAPRLTCDVVPEPDRGWLWRLRLDGRSLGGAEFVRAASEPEARAAAQAYIDELLAHFRAGGT